MQRERKERITKKQWYDLGGFANSALFRKQSRGGSWRYYRTMPRRDDIRRAVNAGIDEGFDILRAARRAGRELVK